MDEQHKQRATLMKLAREMSRIAVLQMNVESLIQITTVGGAVAKLTKAADYLHNTGYLYQEEHDRLSEEVGEESCA